VPRALSVVFLSRGAITSAGPVVEEPDRPRTPPGVGTPLRAVGRSPRRHPHRSPLLARIVHDGSWRNRAVALRDGHAEPRGPEAYLCSTLRERAASLPPKASRSSESAIAAEAFMNNAGEGKVADGRQGSALSEGSLDCLTPRKDLPIIAKEIGYDIGAYANEGR
jgi:hypothetical protein